jgi:organic radical activating enzyme
MNDAMDAKGEYWSCEWLEGGVLFGLVGLHACCVAHHGNRGWAVLLSEFRGGELPVEKVIEARTAIVKANQEPEHHFSCNGCSALVRRQWQRKEYLFDVLGITHFSKCNLKCYYCYTMKQGFSHVSEPIILLPTIHGIIEKGYLNPWAQVHWGGGEPTLLDEFDDLFSVLAGHGCFQFLNTNALILSRTVLDWLPRISAQMCISIDAATRETYLKIKNVDAFDRVWRHASEYARVGGDRVVAKIVISRHNFHEVDRFMDMVEQAGIKRVLADIDAYETSIPEEIVMAGAKIACQCRVRGMTFMTLAPGSVMYPENRWEGRVLEAHRLLLHRLPLPDKHKIWKKSPDKWRYLFRYIMNRLGS